MFANSWGILLRYLFLITPIIVTDLLPRYDLLETLNPYNTEVLRPFLIGSNSLLVWPQEAQMPKILTCHMVEVDFAEYIDEELLSPEKVLDSVALIAEMLGNKDLWPAAISADKAGPTAVFVYRSAPEAIKADDMIDTWLTEIGNGLQVAADAIRKAVGERNRKRGSGGKSTGRAADETQTDKEFKDFFGD